MNTNNMNFNDLFGSFAQPHKADSREYRCTGCSYPLEKILVEDHTGKERKLFYCKKKECERFGLLTVVAK